MGFGSTAMSSNKGFVCLLGWGWLKSQGWCPCNHSKLLKSQERRWAASPNTHSAERCLLAEKQTHIYHFGGFILIVVQEGYNLFSISKDETQETMIAKH